MNRFSDKFIILGYGDNPSTPGRFLADGLRSINQWIKVSHRFIDLASYNLHQCAAIVIADCPSRDPIQIVNSHLAKNIPKIYWTYHGKHLLTKNMKLVKEYQADLILMSSCLKLKKFFTVPVVFFPLAVPIKFYNGGPPLADRSVDLSFVGNCKGSLYAVRKTSLENIQREFSNHQIMITKGLYLNDLAQLYQRSKIIYNDSINETMTLRIFEGIGSKSLVISDTVPEQDLILSPDRHYVRYTNDSDKIRKIRHYLHEKAEAQTIADCGFNWVMQHHNFSVRAKELLEAIAKYC